ncbi:MAG: UDP-N-acetylmuramoyl-L-alanine--D-glutamate ligase [Rickettsiales bacterium]
MINKFFGVLGLGLSGKATVDFFKKNNFKFICWDQSLSVKEQVKVAGSQHLSDPEDEQWNKIDYLVRSPGIPLNQNNAILNRAKENDIKIISDIELFYLLNPEAKYVGITGTNGKSTTTHLIQHVLKLSNLNFSYGGNIGKPVMSLPNINHSDYIYVFELSSYQLASIEKAHFNIAILLNITEDHISWHGSMNNYISDKFKILKNSSLDDYFIFNCIDENIVHNIPTDCSVIKQPFSCSKKNNTYIKNNTIYDSQSKEVVYLPYNKFLTGSHNSENIVASYIACRKLGVSSETFKNGIKSFVGLPHRMQPAGQYKNVHFVNDSKATNFESCEKALNNMHSKIILLMGGIMKTSNDFKLIAKHKDKILNVFSFGQDSKALKKGLDKLQINTVLENSMESALTSAISLALQQEFLVTILLSPGCASFDQWKNFEERGNKFLEITQKYAQSD